MLCCALLGGTTCLPSPNCEDGLAICRNYSLGMITRAMPMIRARAALLVELECVVHLPVHSGVDRGQPDVAGGAAQAREDSAQGVADGLGGRAVGGTGGRSAAAAAQRLLAAASVPGVPAPRRVELPRELLHIAGRGVALVGRLVDARRRRPADEVREQVGRREAAAAEAVAAAVGGARRWCGHSRWRG